MKSKLKEEVMDAVGELPDFGNLLLRESGYPHLSNDNFGASSVTTEEYKEDQQRKNQRMRDTLATTPKESQSDAWHEAGTKPDHPCLCETLIDDDCKLFQYFDGGRFGFFGWNKEEALKTKQYKSIFQHVQWREVQP